MSSLYFLLCLWFSPVNFRAPRTESDEIIIFCWKWIRLEVQVGWYSQNFLQDFTLDEPYRERGVHVLSHLFYS
jgi:hypothetical protein